MYEELVEYNGREYLVSQDLFADDPRELWGNVEIASVRGGYGGYAVGEGDSALFQVYDTLNQGAMPYLDGAYGYGEVNDYGTPRDAYGTDEEYEENASDAEKLAVELFDEFYDVGDEVSDMVDFVNKLNDAFGFDPSGKLQYAMIRGYSQGDWGEFIIAGPSSTDVSPYIEEYEMWANGDVFFIVQDVETGDAVGGIYASDAEEAVKHYVG